MSYSQSLLEFMSPMVCESNTIMQDYKHDPFNLRNCVTVLYKFSVYIYIYTDYRKVPDSYRECTCNTMLRLQYSRA